MAVFPDGVYSPRTKQNKKGIEYDAAKKEIGYVEDVTKLDDEVVAIETELGTNPSGAYATVKAFLEALLAAVISVFTDLTDVPASYVDQAGKFLKVKAEEDGLEFTDPPAGGFASKARAYQAANGQMIMNDRLTKIRLNTENYDVNEEFDHVIAFDFRAKEAGYYAVFWQIRFAIGADQAIMQANLYKNRVEHARAEIRCSGNGTQQVNGSDIVYLAVNNSLELWAYHTIGAPQTIVGGSEYTYLAIHRLS